MCDDEISEQIKTVYAHFGLAIYLAQCLEHQIVNSMVVIDLLPNFPWKQKSREDWYKQHDQYNEEQFTKTLGRLIRDLKSITQVPPEVESKLSFCLARRNFLAHHYFRERAIEFMTESGRQNMLTELENDQAMFRQADQQLHLLVEPLNLKYGITPEAVESARLELLKAHNSAT
ncbi:MAG: hypothetical protein U0P46_03455 [Holophagaceae bacterium]